MHKTILAGLLLILGGTIFMLHGCSGGGSSDNEGNISYTKVTMDGALSFPEGTSVETDEITVRFCNDDMAVDQNGAFQVIGNKDTPGLATAIDTDGVVMLMGIVSNPQEGQQLGLDAHSTALALAYLNPFVCVSDSDDTRSILVLLESLPEFTLLENLLTQKLIANPKALASLGSDIDGEAIDDEELSQALNDVVLAYINSYPNDISTHFESLSSVSGMKISAAVEDEPYEGMIILPNVEVSGLKLTYDGGDTFQISNSYGRWCYCVTPTGNFNIFPNGTFLNVLKGTPWNPSKREFNMHITPGADPVFVHVYGYGFSSYHENVWDNLSEDEKQYAHYGGFITITMELASHIISVVTNTSKVAGNEELAKNISGSLFGFIFSDVRIMQRVTAYISENNPTGLSWYLTKIIINKVVMSESYRTTFSTMTGLVLTDGAIKSLASWLLIPAKITILFDKVSSVLKTAMGMNTSYFKTSFQIWQDVEEFGSVQGQVADKDSGIGIKGATVTLIGDDDNPINPSHTETTDSSGWYNFENIGTGEKTITAGKAGYKSQTESAIIEKKSTATVHFALEKITGGGNIKILNDIFIKNSINPATFRDDVDIVVTETGGQKRTMSYTASNGTFNVTLPAGTWDLSARPRPPRHEDYTEDTVQLTVSEEGEVSGIRDLILEPVQSLTGTIHLDMNYDGTYENSFNIDIPNIGLYPTRQQNIGCNSGDPEPTMVANTYRGSTINDFDSLTIGFDPSLINDAGQFDVGGLGEFGCSGYIIDSWVLYSTSRVTCKYNQATDPAPMAFTHYGTDPKDAGCNCGVSVPGQLYITDWGTEIGDLVAGSFVVDLVGWNTCHCGRDKDNLGNPVWDVDCARAQLNIYFKMIVGTDYLAPISSSPIKQ